jgi:hypothetical protein
MDSDVLLTLSLAKLYAHHANFAGTPRQAIADGYSAVDAVLTALLKHDRKPQPRNHKMKFEQAREHFPDAFAAESTVNGGSAYFAPGADWDSLASYYAEWLNSRYGAFTIGAAAAANRVRETHTVVSASIRFIARLEDMDADELEKLISERAFGFDFSEVSAAVGEAHDLLFQEAEIAGEMHGSKLGVKLAATTNYCDLDVTAGDELTQTILREDKEIAADAAMVYHKFVELAEKIQAKRLERISGGKPLDKCTTEEMMNSPDFMLGLKARYHGGTMLELGARWFGVRAIPASVTALLKSKKAEGDSA